MNNDEFERNRPRKVVFYGRVSTEHEEQISALNNQMGWYHDLASRYPNWTVVGEYVDEGITGTDAKKRPAFIQMVEDAGKRKFDLIVTREVSRFARNTVDTLQYTRDLKRLGIEVYFVSDSIWTMDKDAELRLSIMATLAQDESRKISERVKAGIKICQEKGVLYGNGNIIGYDRDNVNKTYVINEEQAETVRMIFELYASGLGLQKVAKELMRRGRKDGAGHVNWDCSKVSRVLRKPTYMGYCVYNRSHTVDYLEHRRVNNTDEDTYVWVKGNFPAIIDEELWYKCNKQRRNRSVHLLDENGKRRKYGGVAAQNVWVTKLVCSCGSRFQRNTWNKRADGTTTHGYCCCRSTKRSLKYLQQHGLPEGICEIPAIADWKMDLMAATVFDTVWNSRREAILEACRMLNECYRQATADPEELRRLDKRIVDLNDKMNRLIMMKADNEISLKQFREQSNELNLQIQRAEQEYESLLEKAKDQPGLDMDAIEATLCEAVDFKDGKVSDWFADTFVKRVTVLPDNRYLWVLDLAPTEQILCCEVNGQKRYPKITMETNLFPGAGQAPILPEIFLTNENGEVNGDTNAGSGTQGRLL